MKLTPSHWEGWRRAMREQWGEDLDHAPVSPMWREWQPEGGYREEDDRIPADDSMAHPMKLAWRQLDERCPEIAYAVKVVHGLGRKPKRWTPADLEDYAAEGVAWIEERVWVIVDKVG